MKTHYYIADYIAVHGVQGLVVHHGIVGTGSSYLRDLVLVAMIESG